MWNVHKMDVHTNNHLEGWHFRFQSIDSKRRPNIWRLILALQHEQTACEVEMIQASAGQVVRKRNRRYIKIDKRLKRLLRQFLLGRLTPVEYRMYNRASCEI